jgi:hypothetical protein
MQTLTHESGYVGSGEAAALLGVCQATVLLEDDEGTGSAIPGEGGAPLLRQARRRPPYDGLTWPTFV